MSDKKDKKSKAVDVKAQCLQNVLYDKPDLFFSGNSNQRSQAKKNNIAPNLNVIRNKNNDSKPDNSKNDLKDRRSKNQRKKDAKPNLNAGANKRNSNLIQTMGFLSEGIAASVTGSSMRRVSDRGGSSRDNGSVDIVRPRINKENIKLNKEDIDADKKILSELLGSDSEDGKTSSSDEILPIQMKYLTSSVTASSSLPIKDTDGIKLEPMEIDDDLNLKYEDSSRLSNDVTIKVEPGLPLKSNFPQNADGILNSSLNQVLLFQLPDSLPGHAPEEEKQTELREDEQSSLMGKVGQSPNLCSLQNLEEGLIGKIIRYKSGKTKMLIGDVVYDVNQGATADFYQNVVSINVNKEQRSASIYSLGGIQSKLAIIPDWNWLFENMKP